MESSGAKLNGEEFGLDGVHEEVGVELPIVTGNLSPRMAVRQEKLLESPVMALNIDQSVAVDQGFKQARGKDVRARFPSDRQLQTVTSSHNSFQVLSHD